MADRVRLGFIQLISHLHAPSSREEALLEADVLAIPALAEVGAAPALSPVPALHQINRDEKPFSTSPSM
jgi:hypothetical protein